MINISIYFLLFLSEIQLLVNKQLLRFSQSVSYTHLDVYKRQQTRLAVACGISREYYNRIEKGKQPLNDELREVIEKQIERFNSQEPLFLLIDYFRVRFPTTDALAIIRDVLQLDVYKRQTWCCVHASI